MLILFLISALMLLWLYTTLKAKDKKKNGNTIANGLYGVLSEAKRWDRKSSLWRLW